MQKSLSLASMFTDLPFHDRFRKVREAGFDHVELGDWTQLDFTRVKSLLREYNLGVSLMEGDREYSLIVPEARVDFLEFLSQAVAVAKSFDCRNVVIHSNAVNEDGMMALTAATHTDATKIAAATRALIDAAARAAKMGVTLLLKPVSSYRRPGAFMTTTQVAADIIAVVDSPGLQLLYNVSHMQEMEGNFGNTLRRYGKLLGYVQVGVSDFDSPNNEVNLPAFRKLLDELGYGGMVGFGCRGSAGESTACAEAARIF